jgi:hypothetical protein
MRRDLLKPASDPREAIKMGYKLIYGLTSKYRHGLCNLPGVLTVYEPWDVQLLVDCRIVRAKDCIRVGFWQLQTLNVVIPQYRSLALA